MALLGSLPPPLRGMPAGMAVQMLPPSPATTQLATMTRRGTAPPYQARQGFVPRKASDFGDGGAFPECHVAQYPLDMGKEGAVAAAGGAKGVLPVTVDAEGRVDYG